ncbi:Protein phosphatase methylesterase 1 [Chlorella vulgaris]
MPIQGTRNAAGAIHPKAPHLSRSAPRQDSAVNRLFTSIPIPASSRGRKPALILAHPLERLPALLPNRSAAANLNGEVSSMSGSMPPPPARQPGNNDLRRAALQAAGAQHTHRTDAHREAAEPCMPRHASLPLPLPWTAYFDSRQRVWCPERQATFNVYTAGSSGPVLLCLHGGGYTGLSWSLLAQQLKDRCRVVAPDLRCHGLTSTDGTDDAQGLGFSGAVQAADVVAIWRALFAGGGYSDDDGGNPACSSSRSSGATSEQQQQQQHAQQQHQEREAHVHAADGRSTAELPPTVLVGHSMGGAFAVHAAALGGISSLAGVVVIDVVEGTAIASLPFMHTVLQSAAAGGMCKRQEAAHISLPAMLRPLGPGKAPGSRVGSDGTGVGGGGGGGLLLASLVADGLGSLAEEEEEEQEEEEEEEEEEQEEDGEEEAGEGQQQQRQAHERQQQQQPPHRELFQQQQQQQPAHTQQHQQAEQQQQQPASNGGWVWRTPLELSAPHWEGWYLGLSDQFLKLPVPKVLVLAGTDRFDRSLTIGQMQGKFQPVLLPQAGHAVHEDEPERVAEAIAHFIKRFRVGEPPQQIPRPVPGLAPVLPVAMGPASGDVFPPHASLRRIGGEPGQ